MVVRDPRRDPHRCVCQKLISVPHQHNLSRGHLKSFLRANLGNVGEEMFPGSGASSAPGIWEGPMTLPASGRDSLCSGQVAPSGQRPLTSSQAKWMPRERRRDS